MSKWICEERIPTPHTADGLAPAIKSIYWKVSLANMLSTAHFPGLGIIEIGHYEEDEPKIIVNEDICEHPSTESQDGVEMQAEVARRYLPDCDR